MPERAAKIRLYLDAPLTQGARIALDRAQAHYLTHVLRQREGAPLRLFNGRDGEWRGVIAGAGKRDAAVLVESRIAAQRPPADLWLLFAPLKKARTDIVIEKATELGVARLQPVRTRFTQSDKVRPDRLLAQIIEAAEQCESCALPALAPLGTLDALLDSWPAGRHLIFCDERSDAPPMREALAPLPPGAPSGVLVGPEGGFAPEEAARLRAHPSAIPVSLGPRILRAETAVIAALTLWQSILGDWRADP